MKWTVLIVYCFPVLSKPAALPEPIIAFGYSMSKILGKSIDTNTGSFIKFQRTLQCMQRALVLMNVHAGTVP